MPFTRMREYAKRQWRQISFKFLTTIGMITCLAAIVFSLAVLSVLVLG